MVHLAKFCKGDLWENKRFPFLSIFAKAFHLLKFIQILHEKEIVPIVFMVFYYQNCSDLLWEKIVLVIEKKIEFPGWRPRICKKFAVTKKIIQTVKGQNKFW